MTRSDIKKLTDIAYTALDVAEEVAATAPIFFFSHARNEEERNNYKAIAEHLPNIIDEVKAIEDIKYSQHDDDHFSISSALDTIKELSERLIGLKVLLNDLLPVLTAKTLDHAVIAAYYPYLNILVQKIQDNISELRSFIDEGLFQLQEYFEVDLKEHNAFLTARALVDKSLFSYIGVHDSPIIRGFREFALNALDRFAEGDDDATFSFDFDCGTTVNDHKWLSVSLDGCVEASMCEHLVGPMGGDTETIWHFSLCRDGQYNGINYISDFLSEVDVREWQLSISIPDEFYYFEAPSEDDVE